MNGRDVVIGEPAKPELDLEDGPPAYFSGASIHELKSIRFRCPYCGIAHSAAVLPHSPQIAKFECRQCDHVIEVETRPSAMDAVENEFNFRLDMKNVGEHPKAFSKIPEHWIIPERRKVIG